jgi:hypothetical protein
MATTEASADFWIRPPVRKEGQALKATIASIDQFGNEHQVKNVVFKGQQPRESRKVEPTGESIHVIADPVEKEIVAVLKAELHRYKICGRLAGGLGSVQTIYKGRSMIGVGSDARTLFTARNQSIIPDPEEASIESDNATALLNLYQRLRDDEGGND